MLVAALAVALFIAAMAVAFSIAELFEESKHQCQHQSKQILCKAINFSLSVAVQDVLANKTPQEPPRTRSG
jgi:hypothetical protein